MEKSLRQFLMVAELKNLSLASKRLFISQPTLTHNMKKLEESLGVDLFIRSPKGMDLTTYGEVLLDQARIMQRVHENAMNTLNRMRTQQERGLHIGVGFAWWHLFFKDLFERYRAEHPTAPAHIDIANHLRSMDQLLCGDIDLFIGHKIVGLSPSAGAAFMPLFQVYDRCFVRQGHPLLGRRCSLDDLVDYPQLDVTPDESRYRQQVVEDTKLKDASHRGLYHLADRVLWSSSSMSVSLDILSSSDAVMTYTGTLDRYLGQFGIQSLDIAEPLGPFTVGIYTLADRVGEERIESLVSMICDGVAHVADQVVPLPEGGFQHPRWDRASQFSPDN